VKWMEFFDLDGEQREAGRLRCITAGELAARTLQSVDPPGAQFSADSLLWLFAFDDAYCDEGRYSHNPSEMAFLVAQMSRIAETGHTDCPSPCARALADLRRRLDHLASPAPIARWVQAMKAYLGFQVWEASHRATGTMPTIDQYTVARIRNGSMELCAMTLDIAEGYQVPPDEMASADIRALTEIACCMVGLDNDIASYHKEHTRGHDRLNIVDVIAHEHTRTPDQALPEALGIRDAVLALYLRLCEQVGPTVGEETRRYIAGLSAWIRGNLDWSTHTARYLRHGRPTIRVVDDRDHPVPVITPPAGVAWWWSRLNTPTPASHDGTPDDADPLGTRHRSRAAHRAAGGTLIVL
jgi:Terpene synthase family 2, C-terminal metal binding